MNLLRNLLVASLATYSLAASTIQFASKATTADPSENNSLGNNIVIQKNPAWANPLTGSQWISYSNTGDPSVTGFTSPANGTDVAFYQHFTLTAADLSTAGAVSLYADDSAAVLLNGHLLISEASTSGNKYTTCSDYKPTCTTATTLVLPAADLVLGANTLQFNVAQRAGSSFGLDYAGSIGAPANGSVSPVPEPSPYLLVLAPALLFLARRRKSA